MPLFKTIKWAISLLSLLLILPIISSVLNIGGALARWIPGSEWVFYGILLLILALILLKLIWPVLWQPAWPARLENCNLIQLRALARQQHKRGPLNHPDSHDIQRELAALQQLSHAASERALRAAFSELRRSREGLTRSTIRQHALQAGLATAISRNQLLDFFMILALSAKLVKEVTLISGLRPSARQTLSLYLSLMRASYYAYYLDSISDYAFSSIGRMASGAIESLPIIGQTSAMVANGMVNAVLVTRLGLIAEELVWGSEDHKLGLRKLTSKCLRLAAQSTGDLKNHLVKMVKSSVSA